MSTDEKKPLGRILLQQKLVSQRDLDSALKEGVHQSPDHPKPLASRLTEQGKVKEIDALRALSEQHGVPGIDLTQVGIVLPLSEARKAHEMLACIVPHPRGKVVLQP